MICFAAITPHNPVLLPSIGKDNLEQAQATTKGLYKLADSFQNAEPEQVLVISPHGPINEYLFTINANTAYPADLEEFGDFSAKYQWPAALDLAAGIDNELINEAKLLALSTEKLDYGTLVPLLLLNVDEKNYPILPLYYSGLDQKQHFDFGQRLSQVLQNSSKRIAIIASGDMAHTHTQDAPAGFSPKAGKFDRKLIEAIKNKNSGAILKMDPDISCEVKDCGLKSFLILLGILSGLNYEPKVLSYEAPFGVGFGVIDMGVEVRSEK